MHCLADADSLHLCAQQEDGEQPWYARLDVQVEDAAFLLLVCAQLLALVVRALTAGPCAAQQEDGEQPRDAGSDMKVEDAES